MRTDSIPAHLYRKRNVWSGFIFGIGFVSFLDEAVFHQLLHWHHFYDRATTELGLISDGFFHAFSWMATIGGLFLYADLRRRNAWAPKRWIGGILFGSGLFQLYDGIIQHKIFRLHQIRYVYRLFYYDLTWNLLAVVLMLCGWMMIDLSRKEFS